MPIEFRCSGCDARLRVADDAVGRRIRCGRCQKIVACPDPAPVAPTPAPTEAAPPAPAELPVPVVDAVPALALVEPAPVTAPSATAPAELPVAEIAEQPPTGAQPTPVEPAPAPVAAPPTSESAPTQPLPVAEIVEPPPRAPRPVALPAEAPARPSRRAAAIVGTTQRRSSPRRPPRRKISAGRVVVVVGCLLLATIGGAVAWYVGAGPARWRTHESAAGGFAVDLPTAPRADASFRSGFTTPPNGVIEGTVHENMVFVVSWDDSVGRPDGATDEQELARRIVTLRGRHTSTRFWVTAGEFVGYEGTVEVEGKGTYVFRAFIADARFYVVVVSGTDVTPYHPDVRRFLDSFRVTDEGLRQSQQRRAEELARQEREREDRRLAAIREREEAERNRIAEEQRRSDEAEAAVLAEAQRKRDEAEGKAAKFRAVQPDVSAPDPTKLPGLKLYLSFDNVKANEVPVWPKERLELTNELSTAPGVRGDALYFSAHGGGLSAPVALLPESAVNGPCSITGWVKARPGYGVNVFQTYWKNNNPLTNVGVVRRSKGRFAAYARLHTSNSIQWFPGEADGRVMSAPCPDDERWHHVAMTRGGSDPDRVRLYLDGQLVGTFAFPPGSKLDPESLVLGALTGVEYELRYAPRPDSFPELPVGAADEICVFDRALSANEVKFLAGKAKSPEPDVPPPQVRLIEDTLIEPVSGVAFDLERKTVWAITAVGGYWKADDRLKVRNEKPPAYLVRYSYPGFEMTGKWALPPHRPGKFETQPHAGPPVLDLKNNRLFVTVGYTSGNSTFLQREADRYGALHRFNLDALPEWKPDEKPPVIAAAATFGSNSGWWLGHAAVSPDGEWLYYTSHTSALKPGVWGSGVYRVPAILAGKPEEVYLPGHSRWSEPLWLSPDGKTVRVVQSGARGSPTGAEPAGLREIGTINWTPYPVKEVRGATWNKVAPRQPVAVHPDGRVFVGGTAGVIETAHVDDEVKERVRPVPLSENAFLGASSDGRFLFAAEAETKQNRLFVLDARAGAAQLDELDVLTESETRPIGGPFFVSPDGRFVVFRSGLVVYVNDGTVLNRKRPTPGAVALAPHPRHKLPPVSQAPSPGEFKGLLFHLDFEKLDEGSVIDAVSGKAAGKTNKPEVIDGPRGKALRVTAVGLGDRRLPGVALEADRVNVAEGKPFTLALWARRPAAKGNFAFPALVSGRTPPKAKTPPNLFEFDFNATGAVHLMVVGVVDGRPTLVHETGPVIEPNEWVHFAVARHADGDVRMFVNGAEVPPGRKPQFAAALKYDDLALAGGRAGVTTAHTLDLDEFCVFDRVLTDDELKKLANRK